MSLTKRILLLVSSALLAPLVFGLVLASAADDRTLVMGAQKDFKSAAEGMLLVFDTFASVDETGNYVPELAETWDLSPDGRILTLHLRPGVKYHNGEPFNAASAKFNIQRAQKIMVWGPYLEGVDVVDDLTLKVKFKTYYEPFLRDMASGWNSAVYVCPTAVKPAWDPDGEIVDYIGTGMFKLADYKKDRYAVLVRNDDYWGSKPKLQTVRWQYTPDPYAQLLALKAGELDIVGAPEHHSSIPFMKISELKNDPNLEVTTHSYGRIQVLEFNCDRPPFDDVRIRKAVNLAVDRETMVSSLFGDVTRPSALITDPKFVYGPSNIKEGYGYDPEAAQKLLAEAGWSDTNNNGVLDKDGREFEVELVVPTGEANADMVSLVVQSQLSQMGIRMKIASLSNTSKIMSEGLYDLFLHHSGCLPSIPGGIGPGGKYDSKGWPHSWHSAELDALFQEAFTTTDEGLRRQKVDQIWETLNAAYPCVPLYDIVKAVVIQKKVKGFIHGPTMFDMDLSRIEIQP